MGFHWAWGVGKPWTRVVPAETERVVEPKTCFEGRGLTRCIMHIGDEESGIVCDTQDLFLRHRCMVVSGFNILGENS